MRLTELFFQTDAFTLKINPLVVTRQGELVAGDCKLVVDDSALFRQPKLQAFVEIDESSPEARAQKAGVTYVPLDKKGSIGVMAGGAGICMTTMDEVIDAGGVPVAFIDLGGGISEENMAAALEIMLSIPGINGLIINVFGGINNCEIMARGVRRAWSYLRDQVTLVIKMRGHSQEEGWAILQELGVPVVKHGTTSEAVHATHGKITGRAGIEMYIDKGSRVLIQGITGRQGSYHTQKMLESSVVVVAGVTPGKGGKKVSGVPVYDHVAQAQAEHHIDISMIIRPPPFALTRCHRGYRGRHTAFGNHHRAHSRT